MRITKLPRKYKICRKKKKIYRKKYVAYLKDYELEELSWCFYKKMVISRNMIIAEMDITITKEILNWVKNGLLNKDYFKSKFER